MWSHRRAFAQPNLTLERSLPESGNRSCSELLSSSFLVPPNILNDYLQIFLLHEGVTSAEKYYQKSLSWFLNWRVHVFLFVVVDKGGVRRGGEL